MKIIRGIKFGGLQQKIFTLILVFIFALIGAYTAVGVYQQRNLTDIVQGVASAQQDAITTISGETMQGVLNTSMIRNTEQQAFIADDLFAEVRADVLTLQAFATQLFEHRSLYPRHAVYLPDPANDGRPSVQMLHERGVNPGESDMIGLIANMSETMLSMFESSDKLNSCFVGCGDGCILFANDRAGAYVDQNGNPKVFSVRERPWYRQAAEAGELIFTGVVLDAYTNIPGLVCAAPVYLDGELVAVVGVDVFLSLIDEHVKNTAADGSILCVVSDEGEVLFSSAETGVFRPTLSAGAMDLRKNSNHELAGFVKKALRENTGMEQMDIDGKPRYICGAPMRTVGWTVLSIVDQEVTDQPMNTMLQQFDDINRDALASFSKGAGNSFRMILILTILILLLAVIGALFLASRVVKPVEHMTARMNELGAGEKVFEMEDVYRTGDEIEVLAQSFELMSKRTKSYIEQITKITAEKERIGTELALATRIQADMMPNIYPAFPDRKEFDIYATMTPAKEVGGDFYDFFLIDDMHLGIVMADVSGKGVPAALFMMISKILVQNVAMTGKSPAEVLQTVNEQICSNNRDEMFVTVWFGILDIATGTVTAANAGHEYPVLKAADGLFELVKDQHGFVIGGMEGVRYKEYELQMTPGAKLFLYTDGVTEATNAEKELFGTDRMLDALNGVRDRSTVPLLDGVRTAVDAFVKDAEQFDDLTMLCLEYRGGDGQMQTNGYELTVPARLEKLSDVTAFLEQHLEEAGCSMKAQMQISVAAEEIYVNIAHYAYAPGTGNATIQLAIDGDPKRATITFSDSGRPFNPLEKEDPDVSLPVEERDIGGLGIFMTKKTMDDVRYEYRDGRNILTLVKEI